MTEPQPEPSPIPSFNDAVAFHGHACPGLAMGYRAAVAAMNRLCAGRAEDEDLVAIVENDACGVDAVQLVCGCTFGKGNLIYRDYGKQVFTLFNRATGRGLRVYVELPDSDRAGAGDEGGGLPPEEERRLWMERLLAAPEERLLHITEMTGPPPAAARIHDSARCAACGERMMEARAREVDGKTLCIPCAMATATGPGPSSPPPAKRA